MTRNINGLNINYFEKGNGPLIVLLHGWGSNISLFESMTENVLCKKYKTLAFDMPGFGLSDEPKEAWNVDAYADFVLEFLKDYNDKKIIFLGHSFGGRVIIKLASRKNLPFEIDKVILVDSAGVLPKKTTKQKFKIKMYKAGKKILSVPVIKNIFPNAVENMRKKSGSADYNAASPIMRKALVMAVNEDLTHLFSNITCPVLLAWGKNDTATPVSDALIMKNAMPKSELKIFENSGHYAFLDEMFDFNKTLAIFLNIN